MIFIKNYIPLEIISLIYSPNPKPDVSLIVSYRMPHADNEDHFYPHSKKVIEMSKNSKDTDTFYRF